MQPFKILTFNIQFGQRWDAADPDSAPVDVGAVADEILRQDADIVLVQEVERVDPRTHRPFNPRNFPFLSRRLAPMHAVFDLPPENDRELPFGIGLAIFSKTPLTDFISRPLPAAEIEFTFEGKVTSPTDRLLIGATTTLGGRALRIFNTHLQAYFMIGSTSDDHPGQRRIVESLLRDSSLPTVLGGDFNLGPGETLIRQFEQAGCRPVQTAQPTWKRRPYVTDHLFVNRDLRCVSATVVPTLTSDHDILTATLEFRG
jgi:endonuclease/exonuclease/phosphatase family metal-dependent hydrolase